jgi:hypothetical protein
MNAPSLRELAQALKGDICGGEVLAPGPGHSANDRSLSVRPSTDAPDGFLVHSFAGDDLRTCRDYVRNRLGLDPFKPNGGANPNGAKAAKQPVRTFTYKYRDPVSGEARYWKIRREYADGTKDFIIEPKGRGGSQPLLYGGERLADLAEGQQVWIVEGEKKVEALQARGSIAVSGDIGAQSKWLPEHARLLRGCAVIFWPDSDARGEEYIARAAAAIRAENPGADLRVVRPFPMVAKGEKSRDVCDWTGSAKEFAALIESAKPYRGRYKATGSLIAKCASDIEPEPISWLWRDRIPHRRLSVLTGPPGLGKSQIAASIAAHATTGKPWPDGTPCNIAGAVIILSAEDSPSDTIVPRLEAAGANRKRVHIAEAIRTATDDGPEAERMFDLSRDTAHLGTLCRNTQAVLVIIDPVTAYLGDKTDGHSNTDVRRVLAPLAALAERCSVTVLAVTHDRKGGGAAGERTLGSVAFTAAPRAVWAVTPETGEDGAATGRTIFTRIKGNLGPDPGGLAYEIEPYRVGSGSEPDGIATSRIKWLPGVITKTMNSMQPLPKEA